MSRRGQTAVRSWNAPRPGHAPRQRDAALFAKAMAQFQSGALEQAKGLCLDLLQSNMQHAGSFHLLALIEQKYGRLEAAEMRIRRALMLAPGQAGAHVDLGEILAGQKNLVSAQASFERALQIDPANVAAWNNLGNVLMRQRKPEAAVDCYRRALEQKPSNTQLVASIESNLGAAFRDLELWSEATAHLEHALELNPGHAAALGNLGAVLWNQKQLDAAREKLEAALRLDPSLPDAHTTLGHVSLDEGQISAALECFEKAIACQPDHAEGNFGRALAQLMRGNYAVGWGNYEWRFRSKTASLRLLPAPRWRGEPLKGRTILLHAEQGLGDTIQFLRYVPMIQAMGARVQLDVQPELRRLAAEIPGLDRLTATGEPLTACDFQCPLMSLPLAFGTTLETIPAPSPYLRAPAEAKQMTAGLDWPADGLRVGLVWAGRTTHSSDALRSLPLAALDPLLAVDGVHFYSLQMGAAAGQRNSCARPLIDLAPHIADMADTAALVEQLDLVVTVDTAVAHLAGTLGKPVWILLSRGGEWRWMMERAHSPWYPTARLYRQTELQNWTPVVAQVREALLELREDANPA